MPYAGVDYLVFEIEKTNLYTTDKMHTFIATGERFPCSAGDNLNGDIMCVFMESKNGSPMQILVSGFTYSTTNALHINFVIHSPNFGSTGSRPKYFELKMKAYGGTASGDHFTGKKFFGETTARN